MRSAESAIDPAAGLLVATVAVFVSTNLCVGPTPAGDEVFGK